METDLYRSKRIDKRFGVNPIAPLLAGEGASPEELPEAEKNTPCGLISQQNRVLLVAPERSTLR